jgi:hypothetical protein
MAIDPKNFGTVTCGLVDEPKVFGGKTVVMRVGVNYAGRDDMKPDDKSGYFDVVYFADNPQDDFVLRQVESNNFKKGTQLQILYSLLQERRKAEDGRTFYNVKLKAESITYAGNSAKKAIGDSESSTSSPTPSFESF